MSEESKEQTQGEGQTTTEPAGDATKKRITQAIKERIIHLKNNGLNTKAIASTVGFSEAAVTAAIKVGK